MSLCTSRWIRCGWLAIAGPPGRLYWGGVLEYLFCQPSHFVPPTNPVLRDGWSCGLCTSWPASREVPCCGRHFLLPRRCGDVIFLRPSSTLRRPFCRMLRHRSVQVVGTCCTRPWRQGTCVRSEQFATVPSWTVCLSSSPTIYQIWGARSRGSRA